MHRENAECSNYHQFKQSSEICTMDPVLFSLLKWCQHGVAALEPLFFAFLINTKFSQIP